MLNVKEPSGETIINFEVALQVLEEDPLNLQKILTTVSDYSKLAEKALKKEGIALQFVPERCKS